MNSIQNDKAFLEAGVPELSDYLLSKELYWPITARSYDLPRLTIGGLLLSQARLEAAGERIESLVAQMNGVRSKWQVAWEGKAGREFQARLVLWQNYLTDYRQNPYQHADLYPQEVRYRVMLHLLLAELPEPPAEVAALAQLDSLLRGHMIANDFIWEPELTGGFPADVYWFLYGKLKT